MYERSADILLNRQVTADTWLMALKSHEIAEEARPGQFVMIRVSDGDDPLLRRPFSICGREEGRFFLLYRVVGRGTRIMTQAGEGESLSVLGPLGQGFRMPEQDAVPLLVGGGIGVAPLLFLGRVLNDREMRFLAGFGTSGDIIVPERIGMPPMNLSVATDDGTEGYAGLVTDLLDQVFEKEAERRVLSVFACGPAPMLKKVASMSRDRKVPCQVSLEAHMACGLGACQGCAVGYAVHEEGAYAHVCRDGPVFEAERIDWARL